MFLRKRKRRLRALVDDDMGIYHLNLTFVREIVRTAIRKMNRIIYDFTALAIPIHFKNWYYFHVEAILPVKAIPLTDRYKREFFTILFNVLHNFIFLSFSIAGREPYEFTWYYTVGSWQLRRRVTRYSHFKETYC
jgi:hypothetical protein